MSFLTSEKRGPSCPNWGDGGGFRWFGQCPKENVFFLLMSSLSYPSLPPLRDFQVTSIPARHIPHKSQYGQFQADIIASAADDEDAFHILSCLPTGYGKSLPMLLLSLFLPQGTIDYWIYRPISFHCRFNYCNCGAPDIYWGPTEDGVLSTWLVCCCWRPGGRPLELSVLNINQFNSAGTRWDEEGDAEEAPHPHLLSRVSCLWRGKPWSGCSTDFNMIGFWNLVHSNSTRCSTASCHWKLPFEMRMKYSI